MMLDEEGKEFQILPDSYNEDGYEVYNWNGEEYHSIKVDYYPKGRVVYYGHLYTGVCDYTILFPGTALLPRGFLVIVYGLALIYLFLGIGIISDKFMDAIEQITSQSVTLDVKDANGNTHQEKVLVWNATVANLTLMALGSSAPEILLAVLETIMRFDKCPGQLGASTIVGSAAFNLLIISGLSIYAVSEENDTDPERDETVPKGIKKINDMGVFSVTAITSILAYVWMLFCV